MESLKPILLLIVLSGIGYLVYVALNRAPSSEPVLDAAPAWNAPVKLDSATAAPPTSSQARAPIGNDPLVTPPPAAESARPSSPKSSLPFGAGSGAHVLVTPPPASAPSTPSAPPTSPQNIATSIAPPPTVSDPPPVASTPPLSNSTFGMVTPPGAPGTNNSTASAPTAPASADLARKQHEFESAMRRANTAIHQNKLVDALRELSTWYDSPAVPANRKQELDDLLSQLAGTIVYSREHWLEPAYVVQPGDTLETIAQRQQVPWQLLAKINGISDPSSLVPGEQLKVVRGPFHAQLNRSHNELALFVDNLYAGRFDVQIAGEVAHVDGALPVTKFAANHPSNTLGQPYISLGGNLFLKPSDGSPTPQNGAVHIGQRDLQDVFDILSDRSQVIIRR